jgi:hypothetical protein
LLSHVTFQAFAFNSALCRYAVGEEYTVEGSKLMVGQGMTAVITDVGDEEVTLDCNHPLVRMGLCSCCIQLTQQPGFNSVSARFQQRERLLSTA